MNIDCFGATCTGGSGVNGDVFYISKDKKVFLLADGASGAGSDGKVLMGRLCVEIVHDFDYSASGLEAKEYVDKLFWKINNRLIEVSQQRKSLVYGTVDIAVFDKGILTITTLGDSPAYYFDGKESKRIARNKKKYEEMIDEGYITREQYQGYISQMHGMMWCCFDYFVPEVVPNNIIEQYEVKPGDMLVLCCDGLSDWIAGEEIFQTLIDCGLEEGVHKLAAKAKELSLIKYNFHDDITAVAIKVIR